MNILEFIFGILILFVVFVIDVGAIAFKYDTRKLEKENEELKADLQKARERKAKREYKKVSDVGGKK